MGMFRTVAAAVGMGSSLTAAWNLEGRQNWNASTAIPTLKYCDASQPTVCYSEFRTTKSRTAYRISIPDVASAPFDTLIQVVAPISVGWAGLSWGGSMVDNPMTVVWMDGDQGMVSSRWVK